MMDNRDDLAPFLRQLTNAATGDWGTILKGRVAFMRRTNSSINAAAGLLQSTAREINVMLSTLIHPAKVNSCFQDQGVTTLGPLSADWFKGAGPDVFAAAAAYHHPMAP